MENQKISEELEKFIAATETFIKTAYPSNSGRLYLNEGTDTQFNLEHLALFSASIADFINSVNTKRTELSAFLKK